MGKLKVPIDETIGQILGNQSLEENLYILGVPQILAGAEPGGYVKNAVVKLHVSRLDLIELFEFRSV